MESLYNIYFAGQLAEGASPASVRSRLAKLFNADEPTLDRLFSGQAQLLKRDCDKATAHKYRQAMAKAGAIAIVKIAADQPEQSRTRASKSTDTNPDSGATAAATGIALAPEGTAVLRETERAAPVVSGVTVPALDVEQAGPNLSAPAPPAPAAPDTTHMSMGEVGDDIPNLPDEREIVQPNIDDIALAPADSDFSDCAGPDPEAPDLDLSGLNLSPEGSSVLDDKYRRKETSPPPSTDHISLDDLD